MNLLKMVSYCFNPQSNGGESVILTTRFFDDGDEELLKTHELTLSSYGNSASFELSAVDITPASLRKLADLLETTEKELLDQ